MKTKQEKFFLIGNNLAVDFANTATGTDGKEALATWNDVLDFFGARGRSTSRKVQGRNGRSRDRDQGALSQVIALRAAVRKIIKAIAEKKPVRSEDIMMMNDHLRRTGGFEQFEKTLGEWHLLRRYSPDAKSMDVLLDPIIQSLAELLKTKNAGLVRKCGNCPLYFYDTSKTHKRQWCSMSLCGNRAKVAAYAARKRL